MQSGWLSAKATTEIIDGTFDNELLVGPNALATQDALGKVSFNEWINLLNNI
jgi:hypothetical protein